VKFLLIARHDTTLPRARVKKLPAYRDSGNVFPIIRNPSWSDAMLGLSPSLVAQQLPNNNYVAILKDETGVSVSLVT
jgi:hypothetical protein